MFAEMNAELKLCEPIDFNKEKENIKEYANLLESFINEKTEILNKSKELETENNELKKHLMDVQNSAAEKRQKEKYKKNLNMLEQKASFSVDTLEKFINTCKLLGYYFDENIWDTEQQMQYFKCYFNNECFVRFAVYGNGFKDLLEIMPLHPNFESIQDFFRNTQDSTGLLSTLRKYFKSMSNQELPTS